MVEPADASDHLNVLIADQTDEKRLTVVFEAPIDLFETCENRLFARRVLWNLDRIRTCQTDARLDIDLLTPHRRSQSMIWMSNDSISSRNAGNT